MHTLVQIKSTKLTLPADAALLSGSVSAELQAGADSMAFSVSAVPGEMPCYLPAH